MLKNLLAPALTGKGPDYSHLSEKECRIGDYVLGYKLPGNLGLKGVRRPNFPLMVNLQPELFDQTSYKQAFNRSYIQVQCESWEYRGFILQGNFGRLCSLALNIDVNRAEPHTTLKTGNLESLKSYLENDFSRYYESEGGINWKARQKFKDDAFTKGEVPDHYLVTLPESYDIENINDASWLSYQIGPEGRAGYRYTYYWAYPVSENFYLTVSFWMLFEHGDIKELRRERMAEDARRIMSMVELRKE
ncbi:hypothetical protein HCH_06746 [Hahella chejuensis KCTC 2396]|uniref:Tle cognate immunity protein 4 C-terminal domain-containing protein n=1 Tax=Hahella chejuensis (strain KCTC 2396) TaxID=349521 RepID=Q2S7K3_HAHCH|nr:hypothetical protein [Hahella chejuensis]ABC33371.1 hypothetical protein HCH_06746 [Hahella chejuensis KCTC 2396]